MSALKRTMEEEKGEKKKARFTLDSSSEDNFGEEGVNEGDVVSSENKEDEEMKTMKEEIRKKEDEKKKLMEQRKEFLQKKIDQFNEKAAELKAKSFKKGPGVLLLCDSIGKYVKDIIGLEVKSFPGITSSQLAGQCETRRMKNMLKSKQCVIVHVGTNDVQKLDPGKICSNVSNICFNINEANSDIQIYFSSILPRNDVSKEIDKKISATYTEIEKVCKKKKFPFLHTYRPLRDKTTGEIHRHMFCVKRRGFALKS